MITTFPYCISDISYTLENANFANYATTVPKFNPSNSIFSLDVNTNGNILVVWSRADTANAITNDYVYGQLFNSSLTSLTQAVCLSTRRVGDQGAFAVTADTLTGGWIIAHLIAPSGSIATERRIAYRRFDAALSPRDASDVIISGAILSTTNGEYVFDLRSDDLGRFTIFTRDGVTYTMRRFNNDGTVSFGPQPIYSHSTSSSCMSAWVHKKSGKILVAHGEPSGSPRTLQVRRFDANGSPEAVNPVITITNAAFQLWIKISGRYNDEGFIVTWFETTSVPVFREYDSTGVRNPFILTANVLPTLPAGMVYENPHVYYLSQPYNKNNDYVILIAVKITDISSPLPSSLLRFYVYNRCVDPIFKTHDLVAVEPEVLDGSASDNIYADFIGLVPLNQLEYVVAGYNAKSGAIVTTQNMIRQYTLTTTTDPITLSDRTSNSLLTTDERTINVKFSCPVDSSFVFLSETQTTPPLSSNTNFIAQATCHSTFVLSAGAGPHTVYVWYKNPSNQVNVTPVSDTINLKVLNIGSTYLASASLQATTSSTYLASANLQGTTSSTYLASAFLTPVSGTFDPEPFLFDRITSETALTRDHTISVQFSLDATVPPVQGWLLSETQQTEPAPTDPNFATVMPQTFALQQVPNLTLGEGQSRTVYLWVKDSVQVLHSQPGTDSIQLGDAPAGSIILTDLISGSFLFTSSNVVSTIIQNFSEIRDGSVTGYLISETQTTQPLYNDIRFTGVAPVTLALSPGNGNRNVFIWFKNRYYVSAVQESSSIVIQTGFPSFTHILKPGTNLVTPALETSPAMRASRFLTQSTDQLFYLDGNANIQFILGIDVELDPGSNIPLEGSIGYIVFATGLTTGQIRTVTYTGQILSN